MAKKIKYTDIVDEKGLGILLETLSRIEDKLKSILLLNSARVSGKANKYNDIKNEIESIKNSVKASEELNKLQKEKLEIEKKLAEIRLRKAEKPIEKEISAYAKLSKELNDNRKAYKDLAVQNKQNTKEAKELLKIIQEQDKSLKKIDATVGQHQRNVGNYSSAIKGITSKMLGWASAIGITTGALDIARGIIKSTEAGADKLEEITKGLGESFGFLGRAISNMDFSNLIKGFADAYAEGVRYAQTLDLIKDKTLAKDVEIADIEYQITKLKAFARDKRNELKQRKDAVDEIIRLEKKKLTTTKKIDDEALANELKNAASQTKLSESNIKKIFSSVEAVQALNEAQDLNNKLIKQNTELKLNERTGLYFEVLNTEKYKKALGELTDNQRAYIRASEEINKLAPEKREKLTEVLKAVSNTNKEYYEGIGSLNKIRNALLNEEEALQKKEEKLKEKKKSEWGEIWDRIEEQKSRKSQEAFEEQQARLKEEADLIDEDGVKLMARYDKLVNRTLAKKDEQLEKEEAIRQKEIAALEDYLKTVEEKRMRAFDSELEKTKKHQDSLRDLAARGSEDASNNLAYEEEKQRKLELKKEKAIRRAKQIELGLGVLKAYSKNIETEKGNSTQALTKTIKDATILTAFVQSLPAFYEGTENTGEAGTLDSKGGKLAILHPEERVLTKEQNKPLLNAGLSNWDLVHNVTKNKTENNILIKKVEHLTEVIKNKPSFLGTEYDSITHSIISIIENGNTIQKNHKKLSKL